MTQLNPNMVIMVELQGHNHVFDLLQFKGGQNALGARGLADLCQEYLATLAVIRPQVQSLYDQVKAQTVNDFVLAFKQQHGKDPAQAKIDTALRGDTTYQSYRVQRDQLDYAWTFLHQVVSPRLLMREKQEAESAMRHRPPQHS